MGKATPERVVVSVSVVRGVLRGQGPQNVGRRGKPSSWLPRQKLAEEKKSGGEAADLFNFFHFQPSFFQKKMVQKSRSSPQLFKYPECFNRAEVLHDQNFPPKED